MAPWARPDGTGGPRALCSDHVQRFPLRGPEGPSVTEGTPRGHMKGSPRGPRPLEQNLWVVFQRRLFEGQRHRSPSNGTFNLSSSAHGIRPVTDGSAVRAIKTGALFVGGLLRKPGSGPHTRQQESLPGWDLPRKHDPLSGHSGPCLPVCGFQPSRELPSKLACQRTRVGTEEPARQAQMCMSTLQWGTPALCTPTPRYRQPALKITELSQTTGPPM